MVTSIWDMELVFAYLVLGITKIVDLEKIIKKKKLKWFIYFKVF